MSLKLSAFRASSKVHKGYEEKNQSATAYTFPPPRCLLLFQPRCCPNLDLQARSRDLLVLGVPGLVPLVDL